MFYNKEPNVQLALTPADDFWGIVKFGALGLKMIIFFINKTYMHKNHTNTLFRCLYMLPKSVPMVRQLALGVYQMLYSASRHCPWCSRKSTNFDKRSPSYSMSPSWRAVLAHKRQTLLKQSTQAMLLMNMGV